MKVFFSFFCMLMIAMGACNVANGQKDLALNRPYTLSVPPNYANTAPATDRSVLTDGVFTSGYFWGYKQTAGWQNTQRIDIEIDLGRSTDFNQVTFNTARREQASVNYPNNVFVFVSDDKSAYQYVGDVVSGGDNVPGDYKIQSFLLKAGTVRGRYVKLVVIPQGVYLFCDEIQIFNTGRGASPRMAFSKTSVDDQVAALVDKDANGKITMAKNLQFKAAMSPASGKVASGAAFASELKQQLGTDFTVNFFNAWDALGAVYKPVKRSTDNVNVKTVINGHTYVGIVVTNLSQGKVNYTVNTSGNALNLYTVPYLTSRMNFTQTADPLQAAGQQVTLDVGESRLFLAEVTGKTAGSNKSTVSVSDGKTTQAVTINTTVANIRFNEQQFTLNTNVWAYLNYPMLKTRQGAAVKDLYAHHINVAVIPGAAMGDIQRNTASGLGDYLSAFGSYKPRTLLLYMNFLSQEMTNYCKKNDFMTDAWKADFKTWYQNISKVITAQGYAMQNVYLYPYDEVTDANVGRLLDFAKWAKSALPGAKLYMTVGKLSQGTISQLNAYMDVMQVYEENLGGISPVAGKTWLYNTKGNAELLSPYSYYRLMSWKAFANGYKGVGFWAYADSKAQFDNILKARAFAGATNYSVVYVDGNDIVSSRRWEGFMMGIEDYELLTLYAKKFGDAKAKALAAGVTGAAGDVTQADAVREKIITALSE